jgi:hypothetical protein
MYRGRETAKEEPSSQELGLRVTYRNMKTGMVEKSDPYVLRIVGEGGNRTQLWERPAGSGNLWSHAHGGKAVGRWDLSKAEGERFIKDAAHIAWAPPETEDQILARSIATKDNKINELEREIAAIKAEKIARDEKSVQKKDKGA